MDLLNSIHFTGLSPSNLLPFKRLLRDALFSRDVADLNARVENEGLSTLLLYILPVPHRALAFSTAELEPRQRASLLFILTLRLTFLHFIIILPLRHILLLRYTFIVILLLLYSCVIFVILYFYYYVLALFLLHYTVTGWIFWLRHVSPAYLSGAIPYLSVQLPEIEYPD